MPIDIPNSASEVGNRSATDVQRELPESNPRLKNSWLFALITSYANRIFDFYLQLKEAIKQSLPDTATGTFLERYAAIWGVQRTAATQSTGNVVSTGTVAAIIPSGTVFTISVGNYTSTSSATISDQSIIVSGIARSGQTASTTTASDHGLANNVPVTITGADQTEYNVTNIAITVTGLNTFEYQVVGSPVTPATGTILSAFISASVPVQSVNFSDTTNGIFVNLDAGEGLTLQSPLVGVDDNLTVDFGEIGGGTDQEADTNLRINFLERIQDPVAHFNASDIRIKAKEVAGVTRVFVQPPGFKLSTVSITITRSGNVATATLSTSQDIQTGQEVTITGADQPEYNVTQQPILVESSTKFQYTVLNSPVTPATGSIVSTISISPGQLKVFFMRDNDANPIPSGSEILTVRDKIEEITPATTDVDIDLSVLAPTGVTNDFVFTSLSPSTTTMQNAIKANVQQFYDENTSVGVDIDQDAYRSAIFNTIDTETGDVVASFELSSPVGDIPITTNEIGILGNMVFP